MTQTGRHNRFPWTLALAGVLLLGASQTAPAQVRVGATFVVIPGDGATKRFPEVAFDEANQAYLVATGLQRVEARYVAPDGTPLGSVAILTTTGGAVRVACAAAINRCLVTWLQEPNSVVGRFVQYNGGAVQILTNPFLIGQSGLLTNSAPGVIYSSASNEFLVTWTDGAQNIRGQRVDPNGAKVGALVPVAMTSLWEGFPTLAYNSAQDEYLVGYYFETAAGASSVGLQRVKPGTGALIGGRSMLYSGGFNQYPEIAYNSATNQILAISWGFSGGAWMLKGRLADGNALPMGAGVLALAAKGGGDGIGLGYNPMSNTFLASYQSQKNAETWGVEVGPAGGPGTQTQLSVTGTNLSVQPRAKAHTGDAKWLMVMSNGFKNIVAQRVGHGLTPPSTPPAPPPAPTGACTTPRPASYFVCVGHNWLPGPPPAPPAPPAPPSPPPPGVPTGTCKTIKPAANWVCVGSNWLPPWMAPKTIVAPTPTSPSDGTCTTTKPAATWVCKNGNWLPPWY